MCKCKGPAGAVKRARILSKTSEMISKDLDITDLLRKVNETYNMMKGLQTNEHKFLINYTKDHILKLSDSEEEDDGKKSS
jgi:hypothetical protein